MNSEHQVTEFRITEEESYDQELSERSNFPRKSK